jgi:hypothetical protein
VGLYSVPLWRFALDFRFTSSSESELCFTSCSLPVLSYSFALKSDALRLTGAGEIGAVGAVGPAGAVAVAITADGVADVLKLVDGASESVMLLLVTMEHTEGKRKIFT